MKKGYKKLINSLSQTKNHKILHKIGKQWVTISVFTLALLGVGAVSGTNIHADTINSATKATINQNQLEHNVAIASKRPNIKQQNPDNVLHNRIVKSLATKKATPKSITGQANVLHDRILRSVMATKSKHHVVSHFNNSTSNSQIANNKLANKLLYRNISHKQKRDIIYCATHSHQFLHHNLSNKSFNKVKNISYLPYFISGQGTDSFNHYTQPFYLGSFDGTSSWQSASVDDYVNEKFINNDSYELGWIIGKGNGHLNRYIFYHSLDEFNLLRRLNKVDKRLVKKQTELTYNYSAKLENPRTPLTYVNGVIKHRRIDGMRLSTLNNRMKKSINTSRKRYAKYYLSHPSRYLNHHVNNIVAYRLADNLLTNYAHRQNRMLAHGETDASNVSDMDVQSDANGSLISPKLMNNKIYKLGWLIAFADFIQPSGNSTVSNKDYKDAKVLYNEATNYMKKHKKLAKKYMEIGKFSLNDFLLYNPKHTTMANKSLMYRLGYADANYNTQDSSDITSRIQRKYDTNPNYRNSWVASVKYLFSFNNHDANQLYIDGINYMNKHNSKYGYQVTISSDNMDTAVPSNLNKKPSEFYDSVHFGIK